MLHDSVLEIELGRLGLSKFSLLCTHWYFSLPDSLQVDIFFFCNMSRMCLLACFLCACFYFCVIFIFFCFVCPDYCIFSLSKVGRGGKLTVKSPMVSKWASLPGIMNVVKIYMYMYIYIYIYVNRRNTISENLLCFFSWWVEHSTIRKYENLFKYCQTEKLSFL